MEREEKVKSQRKSRPEDLDWELLNKEVEVVLKSGGVLRGRVVATSSYWVKMEFSNITLYINKPFIVYVRILEGSVEKTLQSTHR